jgi:hypothetical protein
MKTHIKLINDVSEYRDISEIVLSYIDMEYCEKIHRRRLEEFNSVKKRRWRRKTNHYDTLYHYEKST